MRWRNRLSALSSGRNFSLGSTRPISTPMLSIRFIRVRKRASWRLHSTRSASVGGRRLRLARAALTSCCRRLPSADDTALVLGEWRHAASYRHACGWIPSAKGNAPRAETRRAPRSQVVTPMIQSTNRYGPERSRWHRQISARVPRASLSAGHWQLRWRAPCDWLSRAAERRSQTYAAQMR
jgi:hypothetical protein